jgi:chloride channel 3/4/5
MGYVPLDLYKQCAALTSYWHSPRVILVEEHGSLKGLVTVKDVLRFNESEQPIGDLHWDAGDLEATLDVMWVWAVGIGESSVEWYRRLTRR